MEAAEPWDISRRAPDYTAGKTEDVGRDSSETSVRFHQATRHHTLEETYFKTVPCAFPIVVIELLRYE